MKKNHQHVGHRFRGVFRGQHMGGFSKAMGFNTKLVIHDWMIWKFPPALSENEVPSGKLT